MYKLPNRTSNKGAQLRAILTKLVGQESLVISADQCGSFLILVIQ